jgi:hydrophobic/amphiphilic exporter-1 (mainly G- bacteria), HAE1 family
MTTLFMAAFVIAGLFGYRQLSVSELPNVDMPTIEVSAGLPGADASTMGSTVATPLESEFSRIAGLKSMTSSSSQGSTRISLEFAIDRDIDAAAQDVQSAISAAQGHLPTAMPQTPSIRKSNSADSAIMFIAATSKTLPITTVEKYAETYVSRRLSSIDGVAEVSIQGQRRPAVRVRVDPAALATRGIGIDQVSAAIRAANSNLATGALDGPTRSAIIHTDGQLVDASQYQTQIVAYRDGAPVRLGDVATVINGAENSKAFGELNGVPSVMMSIQRQPGANTIEVVNRILAELPKIAADLPHSIQLQIEHDRSESIRQSVDDVRWSLLAAAVLVVGVIFLFLRKVSATIIASLALPITIVGTFAGMAAFGYSIDNLSLMSLTLAVGFVVDDAIVMLENIVRHVEAGEDPRDAALKGSAEVSFTILSMTVSLAAVFIPVMFMGGIVGKLLHEFAVTIVLAIFISGVVSITLTPMLCSRFIRGHSERPASSRWSVLYRWSERYFERMQSAYARSLEWAMAHRLTIMGVFVASIAATYLFFSIMSQDFLPSEDTGMLQVQTQAAPGTSFAQMVAMQRRVNELLNGNANVQTTNSSVDGAAGSSNTGRVVVILKPRSEREPVEKVMQELRPKLAQIPGLRAFMLNPPSIRIGGRMSRSEYQYTLYGIDKDVLYDSAAKLEAAIAKVPGIVDVASDNDDNSPSVNVDIDRDRAATLGVSVQQIQTALGAAFGGQQISTIFRDTDQYKVILEIAEDYQRNSEGLARIYLSGNNGTLVPLTAVTRLRRGTISLQENHQGQLPAVTLSFNLAPEYALSYATDNITRLQRQLAIPASVTGSFQGTAQAFQESVKGMGFLLLGAVVIVYIVLGILYESFIHPLTILSGLPAAAVGALLTLWLFNVPLTLYAFVGMVMLVGIVKKNAIMMIDFALDRQRREQVDAATAIQEAALVRFRPIMMTTAAALMGTLPIALGLGAGGSGRQPLGLAVVGGLMLSQLLTLYITPVIYCYLDRTRFWLKREQVALAPETPLH